MIALWLSILLIGLFAIPPHNAKVEAEKAILKVEEKALIEERKKIKKLLNYGLSEEYTIWAYLWACRGDFEKTKRYLFHSVKYAEYKQQIYSWVDAKLEVERNPNQRTAYMERHLWTILDEYQRCRALAVLNTGKQIK